MGEHTVLTTKKSKLVSLEKVSNVNCWTVVTYQKETSPDTDTENDKIKMKYNRMTDETDLYVVRGEINSFIIFIHLKHWLTKCIFLFATLDAISI